MVNPMAGELCRPTSLELGGEPVAAKCSFLSRGLDCMNLMSRENVHSLDMVHKVTLFL